MNIIEQIEQIKLIPVIQLKKETDAEPLAAALCEGGLAAAEVTFRTDAAEASINRMCRTFPEMLVGAGSLVNAEQARRAQQAGAQFFVSAGFNRSVTEYAIDNQIPIFPGVCTPTELMLLLEYRLSIAKFFPAQQMGGVSMIKALSAPFPQMKFMPTGGINAENIMDYLALSCVIACGGSFMVKDSLIAAGDFREITKLTRGAVEVVKGLKEG